MRMGERPLVSVITIFLNAEQFLQEAIESVFTQTYNNWELLLVDDGSTDCSPQVASQYSERYPCKVRLLEHEGHRNLGMSASRNLGIRESVGEYIAFLDADDVWLPQKLERQVADLESQPEAAMVYGPSEYWFSWTGTPEDTNRDFISPLVVPPNMLVRPPSLLIACHPLGEAPSPATCSFLLRRSALETIGRFEESFRGLYEDQAFLVKVYLKGLVFVSGECLAKYRMHPDSCVFASIKSGQHEAARGSFLDWLEGYLKQEQVEDGAIWRAFHKVRWPYRHPILHQLSESSRQLLRKLRWLWNVTWRANGMRRPSLITAHPNPVRVRGHFADRFLVGATRLSWTLEEATAAEVRVGAPDGPLFSRTAGSGSAITGNWVHDGMKFYLQDVSGGKPLSLQYTLDVVTVRVARVLEERPPPVGRVRFGDLRRLTPISSKWGFDRGRPIDRYYVEAFLARHAGDVRGRVLEVGDATYTQRFGGHRVANTDVLNLEDGVPGTTIVADLACAPQIPSDTFDCIILTQTLQLVYDARGAVRTVYRVLKPGGIVLATSPGITYTCDDYWGSNWCWSFTALSAQRLFTEVFQASNVTVAAFGNVLTAVCFLEGLAAEELQTEELDYHEPGYEVTIAVRAVKPEFAR
jgi:glycosyltransferase involved in cell wall biosynthesis/SAM-dependent methyltransferase